MRTGWLGILLLLASAALAAPAWGAPTEEQLQEAERRYQKGQTHYDLGEFEQAVAEFKAAYELSRAPALLFNIGQAYRLAENYERAVFFYRSYLRADPEAENRALVEQRIVELEELIRAASQFDPPEEPPPDPPDKPPPDEPRRDTTRPGRGLKIGGLAAGVAGVALIAAGAYMGTRAASTWDELNEAAGGDVPWDAELQGKYDSAEQDERTAIILTVAGGAAVITGATLYYLGMRQAARASRVAVVPAAGGVVLGFSCEF